MGVPMKSASIGVMAAFVLAAMSAVDAKVAFYIFGDSMYDNGMTLYNGVEGAGAQYWPYGETYFKKPAGRYSDGRLIPDFIAQYAGLPFPQPYLLPGLNSYTNGINFASAGACVLVETRPSTEVANQESKPGLTISGLHGILGLVGEILGYGFFWVVDLVAHFLPAPPPVSGPSPTSLINIKMQVDYFRQMVQKMKQQLGAAQTTKVLSEAVYLFNIGGNDYVELVKRNINKPALSPSYKKFYMAEILGNLTTHINTIYKEGGRKFAFQNIGPLGCMPSVKFMLGFQGTCAQEPLSLAKMHNANFLAVVKKLQAQLPGFRYTVYDFYTSLYLRVLYGSRYGFQNSQTACCGSGAFNGDFTCQKKGEKFTVCSDPSSYLWFDAGHPTQKADEQFSREFWTGNANIVSPYNLKWLFSN